MTNNKRMVVEVKFSGSRDNYKVKLRALHNGKYLIAKHNATGDLDEVFSIAVGFINEHDASNIALKRGVIEDKFAKYLENYYEENKDETDGVYGEIEPIKLSEENQALLDELLIYEDCFKLAIEREDYLGAIYQGILYLEVRQEFIGKTGLTPKSYEVETTIPFSHKDRLLEAIDKINQDGSEHSQEKLSIDKNKYLISVFKTDYKAIFNLDKSLDKNEVEGKSKSNN